MSTAALVASVLVLGMLAYGWFEAGWLRTTVLELPLAGLPAALDGLRITHLSDLHLGAPLSRGNRAGARAAKWAAGRKPDLICITGSFYLVGEAKKYFLAKAANEVKVEV